ncbi:MAG: hypothetical protein IT332_02240 [Ardenticatenales bacterium]|nr:hypothetical protein [Ardenticatenales bacterium]
MEPVDDDKSLAGLIRVDVERREEDAAERVKDLEKETHIMLWQFLGGRLEDRIRRHEEATVDGVPAIEVDGFYFWAPKGNRGGLQVWARRTGVRWESCVTSRPQVRGGGGHRSGWRAD